MADAMAARDGALGTADGPRAPWRAALLARRPVVDVHHATRMGVVADVVFDARRSRVTGLLVRPGGRDGSVLGAARRVLGGAAGLHHVETAQVLALNDDVVTVDPERPAGEAEQSAIDLPRLSRIRGFEVVTIRGQRLGRFVDLLLDNEGRAVVGYLVEPAGPGASDDPSGSTFPDFEAAAAETPAETGAFERPARAVPTGREPSRCVVVPAALDVRVGRDLIVVAPISAAAWPAPAASEPREAGRVAAWSEAPTEAPPYGGDPPVDGDAPTTASPAEPSPTS